MCKSSITYSYRILCMFICDEGKKIIMQVVQYMYVHVYVYA